MTHAPLPDTTKYWTRGEDRQRFKELMHEIGLKVPQIKAHRFMYTADRILIVDPKDNKVAEVIELKDTKNN